MARTSRSSFSMMTSFWRIWASKYSRLLGEPGVGKPSSLRGESEGGGGEGVRSMAAKASQIHERYQCNGWTLRQARSLSEACGLRYLTTRNPASDAIDVLRRYELAAYTTHPSMHSATATPSHTGETNTEQRVGDGPQARSNVRSG